MSDDESIVLKRTEMLRDAILTQNSDELARFMEEPIPAIAETTVGVLASGRADLVTTGGRIVQAILKARLLQQVGIESKKLREKGKIAEDFADEKKHR